MAKGYWDLISGDDKEPKPKYSTKPPSSCDDSSSTSDLKDKEKKGDKLIEGPSTLKGPVTNKKEIHEYHRWKTACMGIILMYLSNPVKDYVKGVITPKSMWDLLTIQYDAKFEHCQCKAASELFCIQKDATESLQQYLDCVNCLWCECESAEFKLLDNILFSIISSGLPPEYELTTSIIYSQEKINLNAAKHAYIKQEQELGKTMKMISINTHPYNLR